MTNCYYCKIPIENIPFRCKYCGMVFCRKHRLPENHKCSFFFHGDEFEEILYQDTLDFMKKNLSVADIYHYLTLKNIQRSKQLDC